MIKRATILLLGLSILYIFSVASSSGRASSAGEGNTGAPGDNPKVCSTCHAGGNFSPDVTISLKDQMGNIVSEYLPNNMYQVEVSIDAANGSPSGYGFQIVSLRDADNSSFSAWSNPSSNAKIASAMGRSYVEHAGVSTSNVFMVDWLAPEQGTGDVSFYAAGNAVNKNGSTSGDAASTTNIQVQEAISSSTISTDAIAEVLLYPNPVQDILNISSSEDVQAKLDLYNATGTLIQSTMLSRGSSQINLSSVTAGQYLLRMTNMDQETITIHKIIKL
jgi:hypothetical protein